GAAAAAISGIGGGSRRSGRRRHRGSGGGLRRAVLSVLAAVVLLAVAVVVVVGVQVSRAVPAPVSSVAAPPSMALPGSAPALPWPAQGEASLAVAGVGAVGSSGGSAPLPIASLAKMMTALVILSDHPLSGAQQGPSLTITAADAAAYQADVAQQDSVAAVVAGETLTERQALEALLIPSADNIAVVLAGWDAGSVSAFVAKMNAQASRLRLAHTHYADTSGLSPQTTSDASDQVLVAQRLMANPVLASIVAEPQVDLPVAGVVYNYDYDLGKDGIVGVKTGSDGPAGGCFVFAAHQKVAGQQRMVYGAVLGQHSGSSPVQKALDESLQLVTSAGHAFTRSQVLAAGTVVGHVRSRWGASVPLVTASGASFLGRPGQSATATFHGYPLSRSVASGTEAGRLVVRLGSQVTSVPVRTRGALAGPTLRWRLTRT
ncbi:MAG: D-alanyl-D-alanine carboxypeptidase family protein, partial [Acidimicrobiales bacterium]